MEQTKSIRLGVIGMGNIGQHHAAALLAGKVARGRLTAVAATSLKNLGTYAERGLKIFDSGEALIASGEVDAVLIATPHFQHATLGRAALADGLHLIVEKPIAAHKADAERLIAAHRQRPELVFAAMFQLRTEPRYLKIRKLLTDGSLGRLIRLSWIMTDWFRSDAYYASSGWRATWRGEGGGVLINQCLHQLDLLQWLLGMPERVRSFAKLGRFHPIEVEDDVTAYLEFRDGLTGTFVSSTGEAPGSNRLEITGEMGKLLLENDRLQFFRNETSILEYARVSKTGFQKPEVWKIEIPFGDQPAQHAAVIQNFVDAILDGAPLIAPGAEGIHSIELANVLLYSSLKGETIELPLDAAAYERQLEELSKGSKIQKTVTPLRGDDFAQSFRR